MVLIPCTFEFRNCPNDDNIGLLSHIGISNRYNNSRSRYFWDNHCCKQGEHCECSLGITKHHCRSRESAQGEGVMRGKNRLIHPDLLNILAWAVCSHKGSLHTPGNPASISRILET